eukprot:tig00001668_g9553.t1
MSSELETGGGADAGPPAGAGESEALGDDSVKGLGLAIATFVLLCCVLLVYAMLRSRLRSLPDSIGSILFGFAAGITARLAGHDAEASVSAVLPNPDTFFLLCIPFIILHAGFSLSKGRFVRQAGSILMFAIPGTCLTCFSFGIPLWLLGLARVSFRLRFLDAMAFGALLAAVDPVATLAIFQHLKVNEVLYTLVLGEAVLNDAVAIALFHLFGDLATRPEGVSPLRPLGEFLWSFLGSTAVGVATALAASALFKHSSLRRYPSLELAVLVLFAYWRAHRLCRPRPISRRRLSRDARRPFAFCEGVGMSGILGILSAGATMAHYAHPNLSLSSRVAASSTFRVAAFLSETFVFAYLGLTLATMRLAPSSLILWGILLCVASRAANVFPCAWLLNRYRAEKIEPKDQFIMFFSGLRGAIAYALSLNLRSEARGEIQTATLAIILFTIFALGGATLPVMKAMEGDWGAIIVSRISDPPLPFRLPAPLSAGAAAASAAADRLIQTPARPAPPPPGRAGRRGLMAAGRLLGRPAARLLAAAARARGGRRARAADPARRRAGEARELQPAAAGAGAGSEGWAPTSSGAPWREIPAPGPAPQRPGPPAPTLPRAGVVRAQAGGALQRVAGADRRRQCEQDWRC